MSPVSPVSPVGTDLPGGLEDLAARLEAARGAVVLVAEDLLLHPDALADLAEDTRGTTAALVSRVGPSADHRPGCDPAVRLRGTNVVAASSGAHRVLTRGDGHDAHFAGALRVAEGDLPAAAAVARTAARVARGAGWAGDPLDYLLVALTRAGTTVGSVSLDPWPWLRGGAPAERTDFGRELAAIGPEQAHRLRLARATKTDDGAVATVLSRPLARRLTPIALRWGVTPNQVTVASVVVGLAAAASFATGDRTALVAGALLLQVSLVLDCVDGDVARYARSSTATGAWLDATTDRLKEFACYGGLAWGSGAGREAWLLAAAMLTLQTVRHSVDYTFTAVKDLREAATAVAPLERVDDVPPAVGSPSAGPARAARAVAASERGNRRPAVKWTKRALHLSIGERWMVLSALAAAGRPLLALGTLVVFGLVSFGYTSVGRTVRARSWARLDPSARERAIVAAQADPGLLPRLAVVAGRGGRFLWARPAALRLAEYALVVGLVVAADADDADPLPAAFALLLAVASHHYDELYRVLNGVPPASPVVRALGLGVVGRLVVVAGLAAAGGDVLVRGLWVLAGGLGILYVVLEPLRVLREVRSRPADGFVPAGAGGG